MISVNRWIAIWVIAGAIIGVVAIATLEEILWDQQSKETAKHHIERNIRDLEKSNQQLQLLTDSIKIIMVQQRKLEAALKDCMDREQKKE